MASRSRSRAFWHVFSQPEMSVAKAVESVRAVTHDETEIVLYTDIRALTNKMIEELDSENISIHHVAGTDGSAAREHMSYAMRKFVADCAESNLAPLVVIIAADERIATDVRILRCVPGTRVVLLHAGDLPLRLRGAVDEARDIDEAHDVIAELQGEGAVGPASDRVESDSDTESVVVEEGEEEFESCDSDEKNSEPGVADIATPRLCLAHDSSANSSPLVVYVKARLDDVRQIVESALLDHGQDGIPARSLWACLCAYASRGQMTQTDPEAGAVALGQLVEATGLVEANVVDGSLFLKRKSGGAASRRATLTNEAKSLQEKLLGLIEETPYRRISVRQFKDAIDAEPKECSLDVTQCFGGDSPFFGDVAAESFLAVGSGSDDERQIVLKYQYQKKLFRQDITTMMMTVGQLPIKEPAFSHSYELVFGVPFQVTRFGVCYWEDLLNSAIGPDGKVFKLTNDVINLNDDLNRFIVNATEIMLDCDGFVCSVATFDNKYMRRFGDYSVPALGLANLKELFETFSTNFAIVHEEQRVGSGARRGGKSSASETKRMTELLSLSEPFKMDVLYRRLKDLLTQSADQAVERERLDLVYMASYNTDLNAMWKHLSHKSLRELVDAMNPELNAEFVAFENAEWLALRTGPFYKRGDWVPSVSSKN